MTTDPFERAAAREREQRRHARSRNARRGLLVHLAVFVAVQLLLVVTWLVTTPGEFPWFLFPLLGWGIGLVAHAALVLTGRGT
jgi:hypothetical protein